MTSFSNFKSRIVKESSAAADPANQVSSGGAGTTEYATTLDMPTSGIDVGSMGFVAATNSLYIWTGTSWFNIATTNQAPTAITGGNSSYSLSAIGDPTVVTLVSSDPEGFPLTWSATTSGDSQVGTLTQADNVFTITPSTDTADAGILSVTFSVTDGTNTETTISTFTLAFTSALWDETRLNIGTSNTDAIGNSTFVDRSTNARTVNINGGTPVQTAFHPYLDNWSVDFSGTNYLTIPYSTDFAFGEQASPPSWTLELWMKPNAYADAQTITGMSNGGGNTSKWTMYFNAGTGHTHQDNRFAFYTWNSVGHNWINVEVIWDYSKWYHIAVVYDQPTNTTTLYLDGVSLGTITGNVGNVANTKPLIIGADGELYKRFRGYISNYRILNGTALYSGSSFTPPEENLTAISDTVMLTCQSNRFIDNSSSAHTFTLTGDPKVSAFNPYGQGSEYNVGENKGSVYFNAAGGLDVTSCTDIGTGDFTFQAWIYPRSVAGTKMIISNRGAGGSIFLGTDGTEFYPYVGGSYKTSGAGLRAYEWSHVAFCRTSGSIETYVNGVKYGTVAQGGDLFGTTGYLIGSGDVGQWDGWIADLQVTTTAQYTGGSYTIPTAPVGTTNADVYLPMDNAGIFDKTSNHKQITLNGDVSTSTTQTKFANSAISFDGTGDSIIINDYAFFNFGSSDFTIEAWLYNNNTGNMGIFGKRDTNTQYGTTQLDIFSGKIRFLISLNNGGWNSSSQTSYTVPSNTWWHLALVRDTSNSTLTCYADGNNVGQLTSFTGAFVDTTFPFIIGNSVANFTESPFNGYIENFQVLKGTAKYTANFTPPTQTQGKTYQAE